MNDILKTDVLAALESSDAVGARKLLDMYKDNIPDDLDILYLETNLALLQGDIPKAFRYAQKAVRRAPVDGDAYYNLGYVYELLGEYLYAYYNYSKSKWIYENIDKSKLEELNIEEAVDRVLADFQKSFENPNTDVEKLKSSQMLMNSMAEMEKIGYGFYDDCFRSYVMLVGGYYREALDRKRYVGILSDQFSRKVVRLYDGKLNRDCDLNLINLKGEFLEVCEGTGISIDNKAYKDDQVMLLPVAADEFNTVHLFKKNGQEFQCVQYDDKFFNYYRIENGTEVYSSKKSYYGNPIPLVNSPDRKRLVMSIFVDGLAGEALLGDGFKDRMPNTWSFFKEGAICDNAYACGEWTFPSIANIASGLYTTEHMLFHNTIDNALPSDIPIIDEYYKREGYYTAKLNGNWRIIPSYGYTRGVDRYVYRHAKSGYKIEEVIGDTLDHLKAFDETDQYLWISIGDLHDISDGDETTIDVQAHINAGQRIYDDKGETSVKQLFSANKTEQFYKYMEHVDMWLGVLFDYIGRHYENDDIVISLFSDHGQGYMIPDGKPFLSKERARVAFMFRGGCSDGIGRTDEMISTVDYGCIMRKISGISEQYNDKIPIISGRLPMVFGGDTEREYTITESLHPKDPYQMSIHTKDRVFYFVNDKPVRDDGRFYLGEYDCWIEDLQGEKIIDEDMRKRFMDVVMKHIAPVIVYE